MRKAGRWPTRILAPLLGSLLVSAPGQARDEGADGNFSQRRSSHFLLYQDVDIDHYSGPSGIRQFERDVLAILEESYDVVVELLGVRPVRPVEVVIYDPGVFDERYGGLFGFRAAGFYHGLIRVRGDSRVTTPLVRTLHHEYVHAALDAAAPGRLLPAWLNEGLAEWVEARAVGKRMLDARERAVLVEAHRRGGLPSLQDLGHPSFSGMSGDRASLAYLKSYALIEFLVRHHGEAMLRRFVGHLVRTGNLDRSFERTYRQTPAEAEGKLHSELG